MIWENIPHNTTEDLLGVGFRMWVLCAYLCIHGLVSGSIYSCHVPGQVENAVLTYLFALLLGLLALQLELKNMKWFPGFVFFQAVDS